MVGFKDAKGKGLKPGEFVDPSKIKPFVDGKGKTVKKNFL